MARIDLEKTIAQIEFPPEIWEWIDLVGEMVSITQTEALEQERSFVAVSSYHIYYGGSLIEKSAALTPFICFCEWSWHIKQRHIYVFYART